MAKIVNISKDKTTPLELNELLKTNIFSNLNCHNIGRITYFDPATQTCTVELLQIKQFNSKTITPAPITNVPLIILGTKNASITFPDPVGTICVLIFMDRNIDSFLETEESYVPATARMHDFTDCIALATFKTLVNPIKDYDENAVSLLNTGLVNEVENTTSLKVYPNLMEVLTNGKVKIANNTQSLATLMQQFLTACASMTIDVNTGAVSATSIQNFENLKNYFNELLSDTGYTGVSGGGGGSINTGDTSAWADLLSSLQSTINSKMSISTGHLYIKLTPHNVLIQRLPNRSVASGGTTFTFPEPFLDTNYVVAATPIGGENCRGIIATDKKTTSCKIAMGQHGGSHADVGGTVDIFLFGYFK